MSELTAEQVVRDKFPDAITSYGNAMSPWFCEVRVWADRKMGAMLGEGIARDYESGEARAWADAAKRLTESQHE